MDREAARRYIIESGSSYLKPDGSGKGFICPLCGSGSGHKGTGLTTKDGIHYSCWRGCFTSRDLIDIIGLEYGISGYNDKLLQACGLFNITLDDDSKYYSSTKTKTESNGITQPELHNQYYTKQVTQLEEQETDYTEFFQEAHSHIEDTTYHRGISQDTLNRFNVGYVAEWRIPLEAYLKGGLTKSGKPRTKESWSCIPFTERLIIPTSKYSYLARYAGSADQGDNIIKKSKVGKIRIFNADALKQSRKPVFIVEGEIDALSVIDVGGEAIGLGSVSYTNRLIKMIEDHKPDQILLIALDNDPEKDGKEGAGQKKARELADELREMGVAFRMVDINGGHKDANDFIMADRDGFKKAVEGAELSAKQDFEADLEAEREKLQMESAAYSIQGFMNRIAASKKQSYIPTGFNNLDNLVLDGGLYPGLYIVGAISSLGKTTFCLQIADQIAAQGIDVLIFSLEMATDELIAKSVSRFTLIKDLQNNGSTIHAKSTRGILTGKKYDSYDQDDKAIILEAIKAYKEIAGNIFITEGVGDIGISEIRGKIMNHIRLTGKAPVVIIDYLQIISPAEPKATDKQNTDKAVLELKRMSRDYKIPIIGISSFNRESYTDPVSMKCFKESGAIEYSSDVLIGLQYEGMDYQVKQKDGTGDLIREKDADREARIRKLMEEQAENGKAGKAQRVQIKVLKNRNGSKGTSKIEFYPMFNYFVEPKEEQRSEVNNDGFTECKSSYRSKKKS